MLRRSRCEMALLGTAVVALSATACVETHSADSAAEMVGVVQLELTQVPSDARCIRLTSDVMGRRTTLQAGLTPGAASFMTTFRGLPVGSQSLWADIFNVICSSVTSATVTTWVSDPVTVVTTAGGTSNLTLVVRRPANVGVTVDFCTTSPCTSCAVGFHVCGGACVSNASPATCGTSCTPCPVPANSVATCNGTTCGFVCNSGFHSCGGSTCARNDDVSQCASGAACISCAQPNANAACGASGCLNTCHGGAAFTLSCPAVGGKPSCGHWDFESNTAEGWAIDTSVLGGPGASSGPPIASTVTAFSGSRSLAIPFVGTGNGNTLFVKVRLCAAGQPGIDLTGKTIRVAARLITSAGSPALNNGQGHYVAFFQGATLLTGANGDFSVNPANGGGWEGSTWFLLDTGPQIVPLTGITDIGFRFLTNGPWTGTVYIDDLQIVD